MRTLAHMLLAILLTISSPAWCACAFAVPATPSAPSSASRHGDSCCPHSADAGLPIDDSADEDADRSDSQPPCRERCACACCEAAAIIVTTNAKSASDQDARMINDLAPITPALAAIVSCAMHSQLSQPPWPTMRDPHARSPVGASLHAQRCLLLI